MPTLRRRVAAIARACGVAGHPLDTKHPAIRETLRGIGRKHGTPARRAAALTTTEVRMLCRVCGCRHRWCPRPGAVPARLRRCAAALRTRRAERRARHLDRRGAEAADRTLQDGQAGRRCGNRHSARKGRGDLPGRRAEGLAHPCRGHRRPAVPQSQPRRRGRERPAECGRGAPNPAQARRRGRFERHAGRTGQSARAACGVRHDGLPQRSPGRGDHGTHPAPEPDHDAQLRATGQAQPGQPGWQTWAVVDSLSRQPRAARGTWPDRDVVRAGTYPSRASGRKGNGTDNSLLTFVVRYDNGTYAC